jgi:hypothetical protein
MRGGSWSLLAFVWAVALSAGACRPSAPEPARRTLPLPPHERVPPGCEAIAPKCPWTKPGEGSARAESLVSGAAETGACTHDHQAVSDGLWLAASACVSDALAHPPPLEVAVADARSECNPDETTTVTVALDARTPLPVALACPRRRVVAPPSTALRPIALAPGLHTLRVRSTATGLTASRCVCLPAVRQNFPGHPDSGVLVGAYVRVWLEDEVIRIGDPEAMESSGF